MNLTRADLAKELSSRCSVTEVAARKHVDAMFDILAEALVSGQTAEFRGFGILEVVERKPKVGRNPRKPEAGDCYIPARRAIRFRPGQELESRLNPSDAGT